MREIQAHTREGSLYYTDEWQAYAMLRTRGEHVMIRKEKGRPLDVCTGVCHGMGTPEVGDNHGRKLVAAWNKMIDSTS